MATSPTFDEEAWVGGAVDYAYKSFRANGIELPDYFSCVVDSVLAR